jgi:serine/threonine-protein kinase
MTDSQDPRPAGRTRGAPSRKPGDRIDALTPADDESGPLTRTGAELRAALAGRYEIEREIGRGGMATVYLAVDLRHERRVALKVVNPSLGAALSAKRFLREIRVTAGLTHPHILPLHDSGEADGLLYYVMPYVEGETLRERLTRGPMTSDAVLRLMREVASALSYAHRQGVVHRDIKPANILLADDHAVVADFGIARAVRRAREHVVRQHQHDATTTITEVGTSLGTPAYMAPEQAVGDVGLDHRVDLYSLGVVAYEALVGAHPFGSRPAHAIVAAHVTEAPEPLDTRRPDASPELAANVMRCLEKDPEARPQSADEIVAALEAIAPRSSSAVEAARATERRSMMTMVVGLAALLVIGAGFTFIMFGMRNRAPATGSGAVTPASALRTLAVIPFENTDGGAANEYFSDGLTDELAHALAALPGLRVAGRSSSYAFKRKAVPAQEIGRTLDVGAIIHGAVRRSGDRLRVSTQLVSAADGKVVLDSMFESRSGDVFQVQDELTRAIVSVLAPALSGHPLSQASSASNRGTADAEAYNLYLKGRYYWFERGAANVAQSISLFKQAIARDSMFARAHAALSQAYNTLSVYVADPADSVTALTEASARRAMALDSTLADSHDALAAALDRQLRFDEATTSHRKAIAMEPSNMNAHHAFGFMLVMTGHTDEAIAELRRATQLDPLAKSAGTALALALVNARRFPEAIAEARRVVAIDSTFSLGLHILGFTQMFGGQADSAVRTLERADQLNPGSARVSAFLVFAYAAVGRWADAERIRARLHRPGGDPTGGIEAALSDLVFGNPEPAVRLLATDRGRRAAATGVMGFGCNPLIDPLWSDERFRAAMRGLHIEPCPLARLPWPIPPRPR